MSARIFFGTLLLVFVGGTWAGSTHAQVVHPPLVNLFLKWEFSDEEAKNLARYDVVIIGPHAVDANPDIPKILRQENPNIRILAYVLSSEVAESYETFPSTDRLGRAYDRLYRPEWVLRDSRGEALSFWPGNTFMNVTPNAPLVNGRRWSQELADWVGDDIFSMNSWDGVFYDSVFQEVSWFNGGDIDSNRDGQRDDVAMLDRQWREGLTALFQETQRRVGNDKIIITNGGEFYAPLVNGRFFQSFPEILEGGWAVQMAKLETSLAQQGKSPKLPMLHGVEDQSGSLNQYRRMRYGLTSAWLLDAGFTFTNDAFTSHFWMDEYDADIGRAAGKAVNILKPQQTYWQDSVWQREFDRGMVVVNATDRRQTVTLPKGYRRLWGKQDLVHNRGGAVKTVTLNARDGIVLLREPSLVGASLQGPTLIRQTAINGEKVAEDFYPFGKNFSSGVNLHVTDLQSDAQQEMLVVPATRSPQVKIFNRRGVLLGPPFFAFSQQSLHGASISSADFDQDGRREILVGAGRGGSPEVRIFTFDGRFVRSFFAYDSRFRGGVFVAAGDLNGDGEQEIVTAPMSGVAHVRVFSSTGRPLMPGFYAYEKSAGTGARLAVGDLDRNGRAEVVTAPNQHESRIRVFAFPGAKLQSQFMPYGEKRKEGVSVSVGDVNADGKLEILTSPLAKTSTVKIFYPNGQLLAPSFEFFDGSGGVVLENATAF